MSNFPTSLDNVAEDKANTTAQLTDHPAHHNALADAVNAVQDYLLNGRASTSFVLNSSANAVLTLAAITNYLHVDVPTGGDLKGGALLVGNLLPADVGASTFFRTMGIYNLNTVADSDATTLHSHFEVIGGYTYGSAVTGISAAAGDTNVTVEDDFDHDNPAIYCWAGAFTYNGAGILNASDGGFVTGVAGNLVNKGGGTINYGSSLYAAAPDNQSGTLAHWAGLEIPDPLGGGGTWTGGTYGIRIRSLFARVTSGDTAGIRLLPVGIAAGVGSITGALAGLQMPNGLTVLLGDQTANVSNVFTGGYLGQVTVDSTVNTRTVTGVLATLAIQGEPLKTARVSHSGVEYALAVISGPSYFGGYLQLPETSDPSAPATNNVVLYSKDNGAGKTGLYARFPTGAVQQVALEP